MASPPATESRRLSSRPDGMLVESYPASAGVGSDPVLLTDANEASVFRGFPAAGVTDCAGHADPEGSHYCQSAGSVRRSFRSPTCRPPCRSEGKGPAAEHMLTGQTPSIQRLVTARQNERTALAVARGDDPEESKSRRFAYRDKRRAASPVLSKRTSRTCPSHRDACVENGRERLAVPTCMQDRAQRFRSTRPGMIRLRTGFQSAMYH